MAMAVALETNLVGQIRGRVAVRRASRRLCQVLNCETQENFGATMSESLQGLRVLGTFIDLSHRSEPVPVVRSAPATPTARPRDDLALSVLDFNCMPEHQMYWSHQFALGPRMQTLHGNHHGQLDL